MPGEDRGGFSKDGTYYHTPDEAPSRDVPDGLHSNLAVPTERRDDWNDTDEEDSQGRRGKDMLKEKRRTGRKCRQTSRRFKQEMAA